MKESLLKIIVNLTNGINPVTGEIFDKEMLGSDVELSRALQVLALTTQDNLMIIRKGNSKSETIIKTDDPLMRELRKWRLKKARELGKPGYCVLSDKVLWSIVEGDVNKPEDLLFLKGIGKAKYDSYSAELINIIQCQPCRG